MARKMFFELEGKSNRDVLRLRAKMKRNYQVTGCEVKSGMLVFTIKENKHKRQATMYEAVRPIRAKVSRMPINERYM